MYHWGHQSQYPNEQPQKQQQSQYQNQQPHHHHHQQQQQQQQQQLSDGTRVLASSSHLQQRCRRSEEEPSCIPIKKRSTIGWSSTQVSSSTNTHQIDEHGQVWEGLAGRLAEHVQSHSTLTCCASVTPQFQDWSPGAAQKAYCHRLPQHQDPNIDDYYHTQSATVNYEGEQLTRVYKNICACTKPMNSNTICEVVVLFDGYSLASNEANCSCTLVKGPRNVIIDTMTAWDGQIIKQALLQRNILPEDIEFVVSTHSHADHIGNNNLFLNAEHIVGFSVNKGTMFYDRNIKNEPYSLCEGIKVIATPGHTQEDVTVLVECLTGGHKKVYAIAGDLFEKEEDISDPSIWKEMGDPNLQKIQSSNRWKILNAADFIVPGHGPMFRVDEEMKLAMREQLLKDGVDVDDDDCTK